MATGAIPPGYGITNDQWANMSDAEGKLFTKMAEQIRTLRQRVDSGEEAVSVYGTDEDQSVQAGIGAGLETTANQLKNVQNAFKEMSQAGMQFARDPAYQRGIKQTTESIDQLLGNAKLGAQAYKVLAKELKGFHFIQKQAFTVQKDSTSITVNLSQELSKQAAILSQLGISYTDFQKNVDTAINSFGLNAEQVRDFNFSLKELADDLKMMPAEVSRNFQMLSKSMAYDLTTIRDQYVKFQKLSLSTGVGMDTLTQGFGQKMDTISGASSAAATLNQILGRQAFNATEILMMTDADRAKAVREAIMNDPAIMGDIKQGGAAGKFALQSVGEALGMNVDTARRFITTGQVKDSIEKGLDTSVGPAEQEKFKKAIVGYEEALKKSTKEIYRNMTEIQAMQLRARAMDRQIAGTGARDSTFFQSVAMNLDLGAMPEGVDSAATAKAFMRDGSESLVRFVKAAQQGTLFKAMQRDGQSASETQATMAKKVNEIISGLGSNEQGQRDAAQKELGTIMRTLDDKRETTMMPFTKLSEGAKTGFNILQRTSPYVARLLMNEILTGQLGVFESDTASIESALTTIGDEGALGTATEGDESLLSNLRRMAGDVKAARKGNPGELSTFKSRVEAYKKAVTGGGIDAEGSIEITEEDRARGARVQGEMERGDFEGLAPGFGPGGSKTFQKPSATNVNNTVKVTAIFEDRDGRQRRVKPKSVQVEELKETLRSKLGDGARR